MFSVDNDMTILITRGDTAVIPVTAVVDDESNYVFQPGDVLRFKVFEKKNCDNVILEVDFSVEEEIEQVDLILTEQHTTIGDIINKPVDYWYEVELNPLTNPQTIIGYDDDGPKIFRLYPEGKEVEPLSPKPEGIETVDSELSITSTNPVQNQAVARAIVAIEAAMEESEKITIEAFGITEKKITDEVNQRSRAEQRIDTELAVLRGRISLLTSLPEGSTALDAEVIDGRVDFTGRTHPLVGDSVRNQFKEIVEICGTGKNLFNPYDPDIVDGMLFDDEGNLTISNSAYMTSGYIEVTAGKTYFLRYLRDGTQMVSFRSACLYDENKNVIWATGNLTSTASGFIPPEGSKYMRLSFGSPNYSKPSTEIQIEADSLTEYEPFHYIYRLTDKMYVEPENLTLMVKTSKFNLVNFEEINVGANLYGDTGGILFNSVSMNVSDYLYIYGYDRVVIQIPNNMPRILCFYNKNKELIESYENSTSAKTYPDTTICNQYNDVCATSLIIPDNTYYVRFTFSNEFTETDVMCYGIVGVNVQPDIIPYIEYEEVVKHWNDNIGEIRYIRSPFNGKKLVAIGDSITMGYGYSSALPFPELVASNFNMEVVNYGIGASEIAQFTADDNTYKPMCIRYADMDNDADIVIVAGGTNDWNHSHTDLGQFGDTSINTFYGALDTMCKGLLSKYAGKTILFMTPIKRFHGLVEGKEYYNKNSRGYILEDFVNAIKKVCSFYGIPVLDMFNECSLNPIISEIATLFIPDGSHPNPDGQRIIAKQITGYLTQLVNGFNYN